MVEGEKKCLAACQSGLAAVAVGLILSTAVQLGKKSLGHAADAIFVGVTIVGVNVLHLSVLTVLLVVAPVAAIWYRPGRTPDAGGAP